MKRCLRRIHDIGSQARNRKIHTQQDLLLTVFVLQSCGMEPQTKRVNSLGRENKLKRRCLTSSPVVFTMLLRAQAYTPLKQNPQQLPKSDECQKQNTQA